MLSLPPSDRPFQGTVIVFNPPGNVLQGWAMAVYLMKLHNQRGNGEPGLYSLICFSYFSYFTFFFSHSSCLHRSPPSKELSLKVYIHKEYMSLEPTPAKTSQAGHRVMNSADMATTLMQLSVEWNRQATTHMKQEREPKKSRFCVEWYKGKD